MSIALTCLLSRNNRAMGAWRRCDGCSDGQAPSIWLFGSSRPPSHQFATAGSDAVGLFGRVEPDIMRDFGHWDHLWLYYNGWIALLRVLRRVACLHIAKMFWASPLRHFCAHAHFVAGFAMFLFASS